MIPTLVCPSRSLATLGWMPDDSRCVAWACRRSWKRMRGRAVFAMSRSQSIVSVFGCSGRPSSRVQMNVSAVWRPEAQQVLGLPESMGPSIPRSRWPTWRRFGPARFGLLVADACLGLFGTLDNRKLGGVQINTCPSAGRIFRHGAGRTARRATAGTNIAFPGRLRSVPPSAAYRRSSSGCVRPWARVTASAGLRVSISHRTACCSADLERCACGGRFAATAPLPRPGGRWRAPWRERRRERWRCSMPRCSRQ